MPTMKPAPAPTKQEISRHVAADLKAVYMMAFDNFAIDAGDVVDSASLSSVNNSRYARELLGTLTTANLLGVQDVNGEQDVWQVIDPGTTDSHTRDQAEAVIDAWLKQHDLMIALASKTPAEPTAKSSSAAKSAPAGPIEFRKCLCSCGENVGKKATYRPGHDARHAGNVGRLFASLDPDERAANGNSVLMSLPTDALRAKAAKIAQTILDKGEKKIKPTVHIHEVMDQVRDTLAAPQVVTPPYIEGKVKFGRKAFPARKYEGGVWEVNENQDGSGKWIESDSLTDRQKASFKPTITEPVDGATV